MKPVVLLAGASFAAGCAAIAVPRFLHGCTAPTLARHLREWWQSNFSQQAEEQAPFHTGPTPSSVPLTTVDEILQWSPCDPAQQWRTANVALVIPPDVAKQRSQRPKLIVCHDMMNNYLEDRWVQGGTDAGFFRFWQWDCCDVFIYFSHHLLTIPPPSWINAAHRHGTQVLGTFITEGPRGRALCRRLFTRRQEAEALAEQLAAIAQFHGFEGWLLNIENGLSRQEVAVLLHFTAHLRARLRQLVGPHSLLVWYDAVTVDGWLHWQNTLAAPNAPFLDAADALFTNYTWQEGHLAAAAAAAGGRAVDVYMGVDIWGRGAYLVGQDNTHLAVAAAAQHGLSVALFGPGWLYEAHDRSHFPQLQHKFWDKVRAAWPWHRRPLPVALPLSTDFSRGCGEEVQLRAGREVSAPWFNLSRQQLLPPHLPQHWEGAVVGAQAAVLGDPTAPGGSSLRIALSGRPAAGNSCEVLLFHTYILLPASGVEVRYSWRGSSSARLALVLAVSAPEEGTLTSSSSGWHGAGVGSHGAGTCCAEGEGSMPWRMVVPLPLGTSSDDEEASRSATGTHMAEGDAGRGFGMGVPAAGRLTEDGTVGPAGACSGSGEVGGMGAAAWRRGSVKVQPPGQRCEADAGPVLLGLWLRLWGEGMVGGDSAAGGSSEYSGGQLEAWLGDIAIVDGASGSAQSLPHVAGLQCTALQLTPLLTSSLPGSPTQARHASCTLTWDPCPLPATHYHVYANFPQLPLATPTQPHSGLAVSSASGSGVALHAGLLGVASIPRFYVEGLLVLASCHTIQFVVVPAAPGLNVAVAAADAAAASVMTMVDLPSEVRASQ